MRILFAAIAAAVMTGAAHAHVVASAPDALVIQVKADVALSREAAWKRLLNIGSWWSDAHTYSGKARNITVEAKAGGCWCETWAGGQVEHGRVVLLMDGQMARFDTALGPLQEIGVTGAMTFTLSDSGRPGVITLTLDYKVAGSSESSLDDIAAVVDQVITEQVKRYAAVS